MNQKIKTKKGFIQIPLLIAIIVSIVVASGIGYGMVEYRKTSEIVKETEQLTKEEKYDEAIKKLEFVQNKLVGKILNQKINAELEKNKKLLEDKTEYTQGLEEFNKGNWEKTKELLSKVSENSPYYQDAKNKMEEVEKEIIEKRVTEKAKEIEGRTQEEIEEERTRRIIAESQLQSERQLSQQQIAELQQKRKEAEEQWAKAETKRAIQEILSIGNLLQDYYNEIRKAKNFSKDWWRWLWLENERKQAAVNFAVDLAKHNLGENIWPEYESTYYSKVKSHSYLDARQILDHALFVAYTAGVDYYNDSDYEKIRKILDFFHSYIHYEYDFNETFRAPAETLGLKSGDCDDWSILTSAAFADAGIDSAIMFVKSKDGTQKHVMVLVQSEETLPLYGYYSDLTQYGLPSGRWWIIEPQYTLEEQQQHPEWFTQWDFDVAALVKGKESSTYTPNISKETEFCNGKYWAPCSAGQKFYCPPIGDPQCYFSNSIFCNNKYWNPCPYGQKFICPLVGDPYCE